LRTCFSSGLAHVDPEVDGAGGIPEPQVRLVFVPDLVAKDQVLMGVQGEREQAHHHALVGL